MGWISRWIDIALSDLISEYRREYRSRFERVDSESIKFNIDLSLYSISVMANFGCVVRYVKNYHPGTRANGGGTSEEHLMCFRGIRTFKQ